MRAESAAGIAMAQRNFTPTNQVRLTNVAIVKYKKGAPSKRADQVCPARHAARCGVSASGVGASMVEQSWRAWRRWARLRDVRGAARVSRRFTPAP